MTNLQKRILTSIVILPLSFFFVIKGGNYLIIFLFFTYALANYELFSAFKRTSTLIFLELILLFTIFSIYYLREDTLLSFILLVWIIILTACSDIGGYSFGKIFKWKKLSKISPNKTLSGVFGSFIFSIFSVFLLNLILNIVTGSEGYSFIISNFFILAIVFSIAAQFGDLTVSYFKRLEKIKDTGKILPGHGGIFDRIDSLMFVVIFAFVFYKLGLFP
tara:strand:+ start:26632 stop:27288 length:657 start_codon:yes stop_codon:yes gene_type:complete